MCIQGGAPVSTVGGILRSRHTACPLQRTDLLTFAGVGKGLWVSTCFSAGLPPPLHQGQVPTRYIYQGLRTTQLLPGGLLEGCGMEVGLQTSWETPVCLPWPRTCPIWLSAPAAETSQTPAHQPQGRSLPGLPLQALSACPLLMVCGPEGHRCYKCSPGSDRGAGRGPAWGGGPGQQGVLGYLLWEGVQLAWLQVDLGTVIAFGQLGNNPSICCGCSVFAHGPAFPLCCVGFQRAVRWSRMPLTPSPPLRVFRKASLGGGQRGQMVPGAEAVGAGGYLWGSSSASCLYSGTTEKGTDLWGV